MLLVYLGRWLTFWYDEWNFILDRQDLTIDARSRRLDDRPWRSPRRTAGMRPGRGIGADHSPLAHRVRRRVVDLPPPTAVRLGVRRDDLASAPATIGVVRGADQILIPPILTGGDSWYIEVDAPSPVTLCRLGSL